MPALQRTPRLSVGPQAVTVVLVAFSAGVATFGIATEASRTIGWAVASAVVASLVESPIGVLDRWMPRPLAIAAVLLLVAAIGATVAGGILVDLDQQFDRLTVVAPEAAAELEQSDQFGDLARDFRLEERISELLDRLQDPAAGIAAEAPARTSTFLVCTVLIAFFLSWGPKLGGAVLAQLPDEGRREQLRTVFGRGFDRARRYTLYALARSLMAGLAAYGLCRLEDVPLAVVLSVAVGGMSVVPGFGIIVGALPALLLKAGLNPGPGVLRLALAFLALQTIDEIVLRRIVAPHSLTVGPAAIVIALVVGFEIYGIGGAFYGGALAIFAVALLDTTAEARAGAPALGAPETAEPEQ